VISPTSFVPWAESLKQSPTRNSPGIRPMAASVVLGDSLVVVVLGDSVVVVSRSAVTVDPSSSPCVNANTT
jgi:hypothetical protein